jgi:hypothetical protein
VKEGKRGEPGRPAGLAHAEGSGKGTGQAGCPTSPGWHSAWGAERGEVRASVLFFSPFLFQSLFQIRFKSHFELFLNFSKTTQHNK